MSEFRKKLRNEVIDPAQNLNRISTFNATVTNDANGKTATTCNIKYTDEDLKEQTASNVKIRLYGNDNSGGWVPSKGDSVLAQKDKDGNIEIVARYDSGSNLEDYSLETDVYSDQGIDVYPGVYLG